jgi:hypothetical protein
LAVNFTSMFTSPIPPEACFEVIPLHVYSPEISVAVTDTLPEHAGFSLNMMPPVAMNFPLPIVMPISLVSE